MRDNDITSKYLSWVFDLVGGNEAVYKHSKLLYALYETPFKVVVPMDDNRASDGINLRYRFAVDADVPYGAVTSVLDCKDCSVLEMMAALALRIEEDYMSNGENSRVPMWFWSMIDAMGLDDQTNYNYDSVFVGNTIKIFNNRQYKANGRGGIFMTSRKNVDMRDLEIWQQAMLWMDDIIYEEEN